MILVGLGSNEGDSIGILRAVIPRLQAFAAGEVRTSSFWRTSPVDCPPDSGDFINAVIAFEAREGLTPEALLEGLKALEREFGRPQVYERNAPRALDLDLLVFDAEERHTATFELPHPRAANRLFVLAPALEVAPDLEWPTTGLTVQELIERLSTDGTDEQVHKLECV